MGGVDHNDQLRQYYHVRLKCRKYYKYIFWFLFDVAVTNTYILSKMNPGTKHNLKDFRVSLAKELIGNYISRKRPGRHSIMPNPVRFREAHFPTRGAERGHRCHYCYTYKHRRRETLWYCKDCQHFLCHTGREDDCFLLFHTQQHQPSITD